jgi:hypothetical protein
MNDVSMNDKLTYLSRAFDRMRNEAVQSVQRERTRVMAQAAQQGALQSGRMMLLVKEEYDRLASETADKIVKLAFEATESTAHPVCEVVNKGLIALRDALSNDLTEFLRVQCSWAPANASNQIKSDFLTATDARIAGMVDDLSHGIAGGTRLNQGPACQRNQPDHEQPRRSLSKWNRQYSARAGLSKLSYPIGAGAIHAVKRGSNAKS